MKRGDVWWASLSDPQGSAAGYRRPVVIVQADSFNVSNINTVIVVPLTTNLRLADAPGNVTVTAAQSGLPKESVANVSQILTVDKRFLTEFVGEVPPKVLQRVEAGMRMVLAL
ncbi:MAG: type II toxin-antitoxin system PemK/MazF family toxin [Anaerolineales bacterium]|nr:type II toxin-antitoxin system PemK/MazF family toxin [Anaerolineales bacterium]